VGGGALTPATFGAMTISANTSGGLTKTNTGTLTLTGANTYTGATNIRNGSIVIGGGDNRLATTNAVVLGDTSTTGRLVLGDGTARNQTLGALTTAGAGGSVVGGAATNSTLTLSIPSGTNTFAGTLGGAGTNENNLVLAKSGNGQLFLTTAHTYTGATNVNAGNLRISHASALGSTAGGTSVASGAALELTGGIAVGAEALT